jgi:hypothetical protein
MAVLDLAGFRVRFPEMANIPDARVQAALDDALIEFDQDLWGAKLAKGQGFLAAHDIACSPAGQNARLVDKTGSTTYYVKYRKLLNQVAKGPRVV